MVDVDLIVNVITICSEAFRYLMVVKSLSSWLNEPCASYTALAGCEQIQSLWLPAP